MTEIIEGLIMALRQINEDVMDISKKTGQYFELNTQLTEEKLQEVELALSKLTPTTSNNETK